MKAEKRESRSYKAVDSAYDKAKRRAIKQGTTLAQIVESVVREYARGCKILVSDSEGVKDLH